MATGLVWHERYMWHDTRSGGAFLPASFPIEPDAFVENPRAKRRFRNLLEVSGVLDRLTPIPPRAATEDELCRFHTRDYVRRIRELSAANGGDAGEVAPFGPGSYEVALLSAGGCIAAVDAVLDGRVDNAYALVRPPGHHAETDRGRGFCLFGNVAIAALHAREARGIDRIAVVDLDVHHGNGTQQAFWRDPSVLTISIHQHGVYPPDSGAVEERGEGAGSGFAVNVPLPPGSGTGAYAAAFDRVVEPAVRAFRPDLLLVPSGLDASMLDPLARQMLHSDAYRDLTRRLVALAAELCDDRLVFCHEGGYSDAYVPFCGLAIVEELSGGRSEIEDPYLPFFSGDAYHAVQPHQEAVIAAVEAGLDLDRLTGGHRTPSTPQ